MGYPDGAIQTIYTYQEFWHVFWIAFIPTGVVLVMIHGLRTLFRMLLDVFRGVAKRYKVRPQYKPDAQARKWTDDAIF